MDETTLWSLAHSLAEQACYLSQPNPRVGCVITHPSGFIVATGWTQAAGQHHAEAHALHQARLAGIDLQDCTAWVTLEPCSHTGRTPPCALALIQAGIQTVHIACLDPNPLVAGRGLACLIQAGVTCHVLSPEHPMAQATLQLNIGFFSRMLRKRPWVRLKLAYSLDGMIALTNGQSQWITSEAARQDNHHWRAQACAIATGIGTVLADQPRLDARPSFALKRQPHLYVFDRQQRCPPNSPIWVASRTVTLVTETNLDTFLHTIAQQDAINELHIEAGSQLVTYFIQSQVVDEWLIYLAPKLLGSGMLFHQLPCITDLQQAPFLQPLEAPKAVGQDWRLRYQSATAMNFLHDWKISCSQALSQALVTS